MCFWFKHCLYDLTFKAPKHSLAVFREHLSKKLIKGQKEADEVQDRLNKILAESEVAPEPAILTELDTGGQLTIPSMRDSFSSNEVVFSTVGFASERKWSTVVFQNKSFQQVEHKDDLALTKS